MFPHPSCQQDLPLQYTPQAQKCKLLEPGVPNIQLKGLNYMEILSPKKESKGLNCMVM